MISQKEVLQYLEETGSTWMRCEDTERNPDLEYRNYCGKLFTTHPWYKEMEQKCSLLLTKKKYQGNCYPNTDEFFNTIENLIKKFEQTNGITLSDEQKEGVRMMCTNWIGILTGGPGTGKTSVLKCATFVLANLYRGSSFAFTAPTGKAARRITESTGFKASTIQMKIHDVGDESVNLKMIYDNYLFIDESSMLDLETFTRVMLCLSKYTHIFLIGDVDQLPSVNEGAIFRDLIDSGNFAYVKLEKTFRQDNNSKLFENIQIVKKGCHVPLEEGTDFKRFRTEKDAFKLCVNEYVKNIEKYGIEQTVILSPYRRVGEVCSKKLNSYIQKVVNKSGEGVKARIHRDGQVEYIEFRVGDPVIHLKNRKEIANGDVGTIIEVDSNKVVVKYNDCTVNYCTTNGELEDLDLAYALSVNKAQGSEYKCVIFPALQEFESLDQSMIFTAISRSTKLCEVIGLDKTLQSACKRKVVNQRRTFLREEIDTSEQQMLLLASVL